MSRMVRGRQTPEGSGFGVGMLNVGAERTERGACIGARFAVAKFRSATLRPQDFGELRHIDGIGPGR